MSDGLKILTAVLGVVSVTIGIILGGRTLANWLFPGPDPPKTTVVMVVDTSSAMNKPFDRGKTKFEAVRDEILEFARNRPDVALALRFTGSVCTKGYVEPAIEFAENSASEVEDRFRATTAEGGHSDFANAVTHSVNDFDHFEIAKSAQRHSIYAFLGSGTDECTRQGAKDKILSALQDFGGETGAGGQVKVDFFGVGQSKKDAERVTQLVGALTAAGFEATRRPAKNIRQLKNEVQKVSRRDSESPQD